MASIDIRFCDEDAVIDGITFAAEDGNYAHHIGLNTIDDLAYIASAVSFISIRLSDLYNLHKALGVAIETYQWHKYVAK